MKSKKLLLPLALAAAATLAHAGPTYTSPVFNGVVFTVDQISSTEFTFDISAPGGLAGNWAGSGYLGSFAWEAASLGVATSAALTATLINPATGQSTSSMPGGLNSGGCNGVGGFICFDPSPNIAFATDLKFDIVLTGAAFAFASTGPDLKIAWTSTSTSTAANGDLYSLPIPLSSSSGLASSSGSIPEPTSGALALLGLGLIGGSFLFRRGQRKA